MVIGKNREEKEKPQSIDDLLSFFAEVHDPRREHSTTLHTLEAIIVITILASVCGAQNWVDVQLWGEAKQDWLSEFLDLTHGIPSHDTFSRVFRLLDPNSLNQAFVSWMSALAELHGDIVSLDGKTIRRSLDNADGKGPIHIVNAWASANELVLAQYKVDDKSNEITALPELIDMLNLKGSIVTIDAMGCQVAIAQKIIDKGADYVLALKENQPALHQDVVDLFKWIDSDRPADQPVEVGIDEEVDGGHGRIETRRVMSTEQLEGLESCERWPELRTVVRVESIRQIGEESSLEYRYYISSLGGATDQEAQRLNRAIRTHWEIENKVHWVLDVAMREDENRARKDHSAENLALIRKLVLNLVRREKSLKCGAAAKQKRAGWDHDYLLKILSQT
ncbi:MAG: ISAs1 family transposase [Gammaproteobacteria bacterium]|nr:MAG: ISAs1 family transposase [Gammaproteobacteria bacterium]